MKKNIIFVLAILSLSVFGAALFFSREGLRLYTRHEGLDLHTETGGEDLEQEGPDLDTEKESEELGFVSTSDCPRYGYEPKEYFLEVYRVKQGDSLLSIANDELDDSSRAGEIIALNEDRYDNFWKDEKFLEVGWELLLPPKEIDFEAIDIPSLRGLGKSYGSIARKGEDNEQWWIQSGREGERSVFKISNATVVEAEELEVGDCVVLTGIGTKIYLIEKQ